MNRARSPRIKILSLRTVFLFAALAVCDGASLHAEPRTWTDATGRFSVEAELVEHDADRVLLKKLDGEQVAVPLSKLSPADRRYVNDLAERRADKSRVTLGDATVYRVRVGMEITGVGNATGVVGIVSVPTEWPEQTVRAVDEQKTSHVGRITYRNLQEGARQMLIHVPRLRSGETARATVTYEVERHSLLAPEETAGLRIPRRLDRDMRRYLQSGPLTNVEDPNIVAAKEKAVEGVDGAWQQVQAIHRWVLDNVRYQKRPQIKTAGVALAEGVGDCQELSSLFVAMCRAHGVPARCVWIPGHSYAEFYLEDAQGRGHWYPAESTNREHFGVLPRTDIILQKGDNFKLPEYRQPLHYARTILKATNVQGGQPELKEIREIVPMAQPE